MGTNQTYNESRRLLKQFSKFNPIMQVLYGVFGIVVIYFLFKLLKISWWILLIGFFTWIGYKLYQEFK